MTNLSLYIVYPLRGFILCQQMLSLADIWSLFQGVCLFYMEICSFNSSVKCTHILTQPTSNVTLQLCKSFSRVPRSTKASQIKVFFELKIFAVCVGDIDILYLWLGTVLYTVDTVASYGHQSLHSSRSAILSSLSPYCIIIELGHGHKRFKMST